jgi:hypothetical protein
MKLKNIVKRSFSSYRRSKLNDIFNPQSRKRPKLNYSPQKLFTQCFLALTLLFISGNSAFAQCTISPSSADGSPTTASPVGSSFTACQSGTLDKIRLISKASTASSLTIYAGDGIAGAVLGSKTGINLSEAYSYTSWYEIDLSSLNISLTKGSKYTFYFTTPVQIYYSGEDNVADGNMYQYIGGSLQKMTGDDLRFEVDIIGPSNATPTATAPSAPSVSEDDTNVALANDIQVADTDADDQTVTFTIAGGTLTIGTSGITFGGAGNGSASFTADGTLFAINNALDAATFTPTPNLSGTNAATISFTTNDGTDISSAASVSFDIIPVNDVPTPTVYFNSSDELTSNFSTGQSSGLAIYSSTGGIDDTGHFNIEGITSPQVWTFFQPFSPTLGHWKIGAFLNGTYITSMGITEKLNPKQSSGRPANEAVTGYRPHISIGGGDVDGGSVGLYNELNGTLNSETVFVTNLGFTTAWRYWQMEVSYQGSNQYSIIISIYSANSDGTISSLTPLVNETRTVTNADLASSSEAYIFVGMGSHETTAIDNFYTSTYIPPSNSAPTATAPTAPSVTEDATDIALANDIQVADTDVDNQTLTFTITGGTLNIGDSGITFGGGENGSSSFTAAGNLSDINDALDAATFTPTPNLSGTGVAAISFTTSDGTDTSSAASVTINVAAVNDDPSISFLPSDITVSEDIASNVDLSASTLIDVDAGANSIVLTITAGAGTLTASAGGSVTIGGSGTGTLNLGGTVANIDAYLNTASNIKYTTASNVNGNDASVLSLVANDGGNTGTGGGRNTALGSVNIDVIATNDDPYISGLVSDITVTEDVASNVDLSAVTLRDVDAGVNDIELTITAAAGTLTASTGGSVTVGGSGTRTLSLNGTVANIDTYLNTATNIIYTSASNVSGDNASTLSLIANDGGNYGSGGGANEVLGTVNIDVTSINDAPVISGTPSTSVAEDTAYSFTPTVHDDDSGDTKEFSINHKPDWASFNSSTGNLSGTPTNDDIGVTSGIIITVKDGSDEQASLAAFDLTVTNVNDAPTISGSPLISVAEDTAYSFTPTVHDDDSSDTKSFSINKKPDWADFSPTTGNLSGTPTNDDIGVTSGMIITVKDGSDAQASLTVFDLTVTNVNDAPTISGSPLISVAEDTAYSFTPTVHDDDSNDTKSFSINKKPDWADFSPTTGNLSGTPTNDDIGVTSGMIITVKDGSDAQASLTVFDLTVTNVNDAPTISGTPSISVAEDSAYSFTPTVSDDDSGDSQVFSINHKPDWASFNSSTGTLSGTPTNDDIGVTRDIIISVKDGSDEQASLAAFNLTVTNVNDAPTISGTPSVTVAEDSAYSFTPTVSDDDSGDSQVFSINHKPGWASFNSSTGNLSGTPTNDDVGVTNGIIISVTDGSNAQASLTVFDLTVTNVNDAPTISGSPSISVAEDTAYSFTPTVHDDDSVDSQVFSINHKPGWASFNSSTGNLSGTPTNDDISVTRDIIISVTDGSDEQASLAAFNLTVINVNDAPTISGTPSISVAEDSAYSFTPAVSDDDSGDSQVFSINHKPGWASFNGSTGTLSGTPTNDDIGVTSGMIITVKDGSDEQASLAPFNLTVTNVNDAPTISGSPTVTVAEDSAYSFTPTVHDDDSNDTKSFSINKKPDWADFSILLGTLSGTPENGDVGTTSGIVITVKDGSDAQASLAAFNLTVTNVNDAPTISGSSATTIAEDTAYSFTPTVDDDDSGDTKKFSINKKPDWADFSTATGELSGTPTNDDIGVTSGMIITVKDGSDEQASLTAFSLTVTNVNDTPVISGSPTVTVAEDSAYSFTPTVHDDDSSDTKSFSINKKPDWADFSILLGTLSGTPENGDVGTTSGIIITVTDGSYAQASLAAFDLTVTNVNDAPTISGSPTVTVAEDSAYSFTPTVSDDDSGDTKVFSISTKPSWADFSTTTGELSGKPENVDVGTTSDIIITVTDGSHAQASLAAFDLTVTNVNDAPVAVDDTFETSANSGDRYTLSVLDNDSDDDGDELVIEGADANLGRVSIADNALVYQADADFIGTVKLTYSITDGNDARDSAVVTLTINDSAQALAPSITVPDNITVKATALYTKVNIGTATATDQNGDPIAVSMVDENLLFSPGLHDVYWQATDALGRRSVAAQQVTVHPLVSLSQDQIIYEGSKAEIQVFLNGTAPRYPVEIPYTITGFAHDGNSNVVSINEGLVGRITFGSLSGSEIEKDETMVVTLGESVNRGSKFSTEIVVSEKNIAPELSFSITQNGENRQMVSQAEGIVTVHAIVTDANPDDTDTVAWSGGSLENTDNDEKTFSFDPQNHTVGSYKLTATATDNGEPKLSVTKDIFIDIKAAFAALSNAQDTDGDNIPDKNEGYGDDDGDGIPNYQDSQRIETCNVVPETVDIQTRFLVEGEPGVCLRKGVVSANSVQGGLLLQETELVTDTVAQNIGGIFDYIAYGLPQHGQVYNIVFPQLLPIPKGAIYRKLTARNGWKDFTVDADNRVLSAVGAQGYCPPPGDVIWVVGLQENSWCVQLQIQDGGPNDDDGIANGTIIDPGGVAVPLNGNTFPVAEDDSVSLIQNNEVTVYVLSNDRDVDGDDLIVANASAKFGAVVINAQESITYTPTMDYVGNDTVTYSINDGHGGTAFAKVNVTVNAPDASPIYNKSQGGGSMSWLFSCALFLLAVGRRCGNKALMVVLVTLSFSSYAVDSALSDSFVISDTAVVSDYMVISDTAEISDDAVMSDTILVSDDTVISDKTVLSNTDMRKWSIAVNTGFSRMHGNSNLTGIPAENIVDIDDTGTSWGVTLGYHITPTWQITLGYLDLGEADAVLQSNTFNYHETVTQVTPVFGEGIVLGLNYQFWEYNKFSSEVMAGAFAWRSEIDSTYEDVTLEHEQESVDPYAGLSFAYALSQEWQVGLEMKRYFLDVNDVDNLSLILAYYF